MRSRRETVTTPALASAPLPFDGLRRGHYAAILADPPWRFKSYTAPQSLNPSSRRDNERHYSVLRPEEIAALPVRQLAAPDCHLFLWTTGPCLRLAFDVLDAWGFRYSSTAFVWVKLKRTHQPTQLRFLPLLDGDLHVGLGLTTRKNTEICLLARRGSPRRIGRGVREVILAPVREHSRKPDEARVLIEDYCAGPYLELFARSTRPGWTAWGDETRKFEAAAA
jgi:N6-adenosine-specific RNA methylase IME4